MRKGTKFTQRTTSGSYDARHIDGKTLWLVVCHVRGQWVVAFRDFANGTIHRLTSGTNQRDAYKAARKYRDNWSPGGLRAECSVLVHCTAAQAKAEAEAEAEAAQ